MSAFESVMSLDPQRIWEGVHGRVVHGERISRSGSSSSTRRASSRSTATSMSNSGCVSAAHPCFASGTGTRALGPLKVVVRDRRIVRQNLQPYAVVY